MLNLRFFVTYVLIVVMALITAWGTYARPTLELGGLVQEGNAKLNELKTMDKGLDERAGWDLSSHSLEQRRQLKEDLAHYLSVVNRVLEIGSKRHLFFEDRAQILTKRDRAEFQQKAIEAFENQNGETFDPKRMVMNASSKKVF